ncbi:MAG: rhomboid family intramembrane serine protease [Bacteroides sp.]|nr:rhomboid family intramembrane serine protease [Bacteroides sp.]MCM1413680.1 rhomboid family intramembrane serine protease [Bacteroides sp.]MCM1471859.1 rhomboid family intramembrane serine protease [Bacteroides sp.]
MNGFERMVRSMPVVTKNLIIINIIVFVATLVPSISGKLMAYCSLHFYEAPNFNLAQLVTYMFMHGGFIHLFFNMFTLYMFGIALEYTMGSKRFLIFYMVCGVGAALIQEAVWALTLPDIVIEAFAAQNYVSVSDVSNYMAIHPEIMKMNLNIFTTVGASGAIYGVLMAFGMIYPNRPIYMMFIPVPVKAKYMVLMWGGLELLMGMSEASDGIAHFAHLGGMIFGFLLITYWKKKGLIHGDNF